MVKRDWSATVDSWGTSKYNKWHELERRKAIQAHPEWYDENGNAKLGKTIENFDVEAYQNMIARCR